MAGARHKVRAKVKGHIGVIDIPSDTKRNLGVTASEAFTLQCISKLGEPTAKDLRTMTGKCSPYTSHMTAELERRGYITKHKTLVDLRTYIVRLTPAGKKIVRSL
jgi:DNA-binding MarR family transcriptional regulator